MKKVLIAIGVLTVLLLVLGFNFIRKNINAPFILPSSNLIQKIEQQATGENPDAPLKISEGYRIGVFAKDLGGPRVLTFSPKGILVVSLMNQGNVVALPDADNDGQAETKIILSGLDRPHGMAFFEGKLYVAEETRIVRYNFDNENISATFDKELFKLPSGGRHFTRSLVFDSVGNLYISLGSTCDVCVEKEPFIATVLVSDKDGKTPRIFSRGLRNAVYLTLDPKTNKVWTTEMGRDFLGDNIPPDEINILQDGGDYGWPYCYGDKVWDKSYGQRNQIFCNTTIAPFYKIPAHSAPLGLVFIDSAQMPQDWQGDLLVSYHGSWNRSAPTGYKIVRIATSNPPHEEDFITGFLENGVALGRPTGLAFDDAGSLYIADDKKSAVYKVVKKMP